ncbi:NfeD family protein [Clostridium aminobutyricum]|uniref:NfeD family protein n=1 Tax=Clostridium aminobutyricum TaxID=33953 RepID=A0A939IIN6_CLOAM|nr:NfeD family protein [Clostridium aminobutyricum]MBN7772738.1 NfeD family protein [Clostridium aminobutyricum]
MTIVSIGDLITSFNPSIVWVILALIFAIIEAFTMGLTTIWFCGGAVVASLLAMVNAPIGVQVAMFLIVSFVLLYFTRPIAQKKLKVGSEKTNAEALIGKIGFVTQTIQPFSTGQVKLEGKEWTAIAEDRSITIEKGSKVVAVKIEGVKLVVVPEQ